MRKTDHHSEFIVVDKSFKLVKHRVEEKNERPPGCEARKENQGPTQSEPGEDEGVQEESPGGRLVTHSVFQDDISGSYGTSASVIKLSDPSHQWMDICPFAPPRHDLIERRGVVTSLTSKDTMA